MTSVARAGEWRDPGLRRLGQVAILSVAVIGGALAGMTGSIALTLVLAAAALVAAILALPAIATLAFVFMLYTNVPAVATQEYAIPYALAAAFSALLLVPFVGVLLRREPILLAPVIPVIGVYIVVLLASALQAASPTIGFEHVGLALAEGLLVVFLITNVVRTPSMLRATVVALLLAALFMGGLSLLQEVTQTYDSTWGGFARVAEGGRLGEDGERVRLAGPIAEHNRYAQIMLVVVPLAIWAGLAHRGWLRWLGILAGTAAAAGLLLTFSRGAALGLLSLAGLAIVLRLVRARYAIPVLLLAVLAVVLVAPEYIARIQTLPEVGAAFAAGETEADLSILGRLTLNLAAWAMFLDHPILGVGPGNFPVLSVEYTREVGLRPFTTPFEAHNLYLEVLAETGIIGLVAFIGLLAYLAIGLWRRRRELLGIRPRDAGLATAILFSLAAYAITGVFLHMSYDRYFWIIVALAAAAIVVLRDGASERAGPRMHGG